jgi:ribosome-associated toxin RatA of RatAB toxin-antitoxin module
MAKFTASYEFAQDPDCIYRILSDIEHMNEFMPLCKRSQVLSRRTTADAEVVEANFLLRYRQIEFERSFDLVLTLRPVERCVEVATTDTGFGSGVSRCTVSGMGRSGSRVVFETDYRIRNLFFRLFFGRRLLLLGVGRVMDCVRQRAETLSGS